MDYQVTMPFKGISAADRRRDRRSRLVEAAFAIIGDEGAGTLGVGRVCRVAGLSKRYFYESFASLAELQSAVVDHAIAVMIERVDPFRPAGPGGPPQAWLEAFVGGAGRRRASRPGPAGRDPWRRAQSVPAPDHRRGRRCDGTAGIGPAGGPSCPPGGVRPDRHLERVVPRVAPGAAGDGAARGTGRHARRPVRPPRDRQRDQPVGRRVRAASQPGRDQGAAAEGSSGRRPVVSE